jgi:CheY-like chemotaxis protein/HPt (histidine-containing phosphotransfer) domain-containing protein
MAWIESPSPRIENGETSPAAATLLALDCRVLVVDDGDINRKLIRLVLGRAGAKIVEAENGRQAVELALAEPFDLILMDMQMPVMDGYSATQALRRQGMTLPIIALTANAMQGDEAKCLQVGCTAYLAKPLDQEILLATVAANLAERKANAAASDAKLVSPSLSQSPPPPLSSSASPQAASAIKLVSTLPMDDNEFREIVVMFVGRLKEKLPEFQTALAGNDWSKLAALLHWLKGTSGSVGFPQLSQLAAAGEKRVSAGEHEDLAALLAEVEQLAHCIAVE